MFLAFDKPKSPVSGWTIPCIGIAAISNSGAVSQPTYARLSALANTYGKQGATDMPFFLTTEADSIVGPIGVSVPVGNDLDGNASPITPIGLICRTVGVKGRHGEVYDMWYGSTGINDGDNYPGDATRTFVQVGQMVFKWNGSTILRT